MLSVHRHDLCMWTINDNPMCTYKNRSIKYYKRVVRKGGGGGGGGGEGKIERCKSGQVGFMSSVMASQAAT